MGRLPAADRAVSSRARGQEDGLEVWLDPGLDVRSSYMYVNSGTSSRSTVYMVSSSSIFRRSIASTSASSASMQSGSAVLPKRTPTTRFCVRAESKHSSSHVADGSDGSALDEGSSIFPPVWVESGW